MKPLEKEKINGGITIVRNNITPHYLPQSEDDYTMQTFTDLDGKEYQEKVMNPRIVDYWTWDEKIEYSNCVALLTYTEYIRLNKSLSEAKGYNKHGKTARVWPIIPTLTKVNQQYDEEGVEISFGLLCRVDIEATDLENFSELFEGLELIDSFNLTNFEGEVQDIICEGLTTSEVDWYLEHYDLVGQNIEGLLLWLEAGPPSPAMMTIIENLVNKGLIIGVADNEEN